MTLTSRTLPKGNSKNESPKWITGAEALMDSLKIHGVKAIFGYPGGAILPIYDAVHKAEQDGWLKHFMVRHEQGGSHAADGYARSTGEVGVCFGTSGPGATNLVTGIATAQMDSVPLVVVTGQVPRPAIGTDAFQETDIFGITLPIVKHSWVIRNPSDIAKVVSEAFFIASSGRPGPVLIDIPMNLQKSWIYPNKIRKFKTPNKNNLNLKFNINKLISLLKKSNKPIIILGGGIRYSNSYRILKDFLKKFQIPIVATWSGTDLIDHNDKRYIGNIGVYGNRSANIITQNSDLIICLGSRLDTRVTGGNPGSFATKAKKIVVDVDKYELSKKRGLKIDLKINSDLKLFFNNFKKNKINIIRKNWLDKSINLKKKFCYSKINNNNKVNPYTFVLELSKILNKNSIIIGDTGSHLTWLMQSFKIKNGQMLFSAFGNSPMGYALPASIGAQIINKKKKIVSLNGDGSIQLNIQELQTLKKLKLPIKIIIFNNNGYGIIKQFQDLYLNKRYEASDRVVSNPNFRILSKGYGIKYHLIRNNKNLSKLKTIIRSNKSEIIEVNIEDNEKIIPKLEFGKPIDDLSPKINLEKVSKYLS